MLLPVLADPGVFRVFLEELGLGGIVEAVEDRDPSINFHAMLMSVLRTRREGIDLSHHSSHAWDVGRYVGAARVEHVPVLVLGEEDFSRLWI